MSNLTPAERAIADLTPITTDQIRALAAGDKALDDDAYVVLSAMLREIDGAHRRSPRGTPWLT